jgi:hypothetical protein
MMTPEKIQESLLQTIAFNKVHYLYDETLKVAKSASVLMSRTSEEQFTEVTKYRIRETEEQKAQRARLTNPITAAAIAPIYGYFSEIKRVDGIKQHIESDNEQIKSSVLGKYSNYYQGEDLYTFLFNSILHLNKYDPNSWIIFAQEIINDTVNFYPLQASSTEAIDYQYDQNGRLLYLTVKFTEKKRKEGSREEKTQDVYLKYAPGVVSHAVEYLGEGFDTGVDMDLYEQFTIEDKSFLVATFTNPTTSVPAFKVGAYVDKTKGVSVLPIIEAEPILKDLIRDKSYLDTNKTVQVFPRRTEYVKRCNYSDDESTCLDGYLNGIRDEKHLCPACHGSGKQAVRSEQDVLTLAWPDTPEELLELEKLSYTEQPDTNLPSFLREEVERAKQDVFRAVFNQETVDKSMTVQTATEIRIEYDKIYNKLMPFAERIARAWELGIKCGFEYLGGDLKSVELSFPYDFKLKSIPELIDEYGRAKSSGLPFSILHSIQSDLLSKQYRNSPNQRQEIEAVASWKPWRDKTTEEIAMIIGSRSETDKQRVLWENWSEISGEIMREELEFYRLSATGQKQIIDNKVEEYSGRVQYRTAAPIDAQLFE